MENVLPVHSLEAIVLCHGKDRGPGQNLMSTFPRYPGFISFRDAAALPYS